jgi:hypothetical protein
MRIKPTATIGGVIINYSTSDIESCRRGATKPLGDRAMPMLADRRWPAIGLWLQATAPRGDPACFSLIHNKTRGVSSPRRSRMKTLPRSALGSLDIDRPLGDLRQLLIGLFFLVKGLLEQLRCLSEAKLQRPSA